MVARGRPQPHLRVVVSTHFEERWVERVERLPRRLSRMLTALLRDQIGKGLQTDSEGFPLLELDAEAIGLPCNMVVPLVPKLNGVWIALTVRPNREGDCDAESLSEVEIYREKYTG